MKIICYFTLIMYILLSCQRDDFYDIKDVKLIVGDSGSVKIKRLDVIIENGGIYNTDCNNDGVNDFAYGEYNIDVNDDGINDFALCSFYYYYQIVTKGSVYYWSVKSLSENNKVLCDTIWLFEKFSFFFAPKPLFIKDTLSPTYELWFHSPPEINLSSPPFHSIIDDRYPGGGFLLFKYAQTYYPTLPPYVVKGGITWEEFNTINEKYLGFLSENNGIATIGWMKLKYNVSRAEVLLKEIGTAEFPLSR